MVLSVLRARPGAAACPGAIDESEAYRDAVRAVADSDGGGDFDELGLMTVTVPAAWLATYIAVGVTAMSNGSVPGGPG
jgi:hypothetical protein